ncbi:MAG: 5-(carboxyamino)imidazole ribonucleotide synthase [Deltaproteobacteria bacterium]|nr:5-(carboxyamino)imidazole ribonucleotide synthase [Deltaproteobacteria bacterium]
MSPINPGSTIGIVGSGQLGRMLAAAAQRMGYRVAVYSPESEAPASALADYNYVAPYESREDLQDFAQKSDVVTFEFENIPRTALDLLSAAVPVRPSPEALYTFQHRLREKLFLKSLGLALPRFAEVANRDQLLAALKEIGAPAVLKTAGFGYDGKGQYKIKSLQDADSLKEIWNGQTYVLEEFVDFEREVSMVAARGLKGEFAHYGLIENHHTSHILDYSLAGAHLHEQAAKQAAKMTRAIFEALNVCGVMCVEFFMRKDGTLLVNEVAPRTHNSGHLTIEACVTSQFEQQLRAVCGLPMGSTSYVSSAAMANLLGDLWEPQPPRWDRLLEHNVALHLYGKSAARKGRKMGHITALAGDPHSAREAVISARSALHP